MKVTEDAKIGYLMAEAFEKCHNTNCVECPVYKDKTYNDPNIKACYLNLRLKDLGETE